jgi:hypothetical protein
MYCTEIQRQFGKGSVMRMNDHARVTTGSISTGSLSLDIASGVGVPARLRRRGLRPGVVGEDDPRLPRDRRGPAARRHLRLHRHAADRDAEGRRRGESATASA